MTSGKAECPRCGRSRFVHQDRHDAPCSDCRTLKVPVLDLNDVSWKDEGLCAQTDPEEFFDDHTRSSVVAKRICAGCPVKAKCLEYALTNDERYGVWGGMSAWERSLLVLAA